MYIFSRCASRRQVKSLATQLMTVFLVLGLVVCLQGCASFTANSYKALSTAGATYDATMKSIADLHRQGQVSDTVKNEAIVAGDKFWSAYHEAVTALEIYQATEASADPNAEAAAKSKLLKALDELQSKLDQIQAYLPADLKGVK